MLDTVMFLKQCLDGHADLVDIVMGRPQPLVKQGMELMQGLLDEMFGLPPGPTDQEHVKESTGDSLPEAMEVSESEVEVENRLEVELEQQSESNSEVEYRWEQTQAEDLMDIEAEECSGTESDESDEFDDDSIIEEYGDYTDDDYVDDNRSEYANYSTTILSDHKKASRKRKENCEKARKDRDALWTRFGSRVEEAEEPEEDHEERSRIKRQKRSPKEPKEKPEESKLTASHQPPAPRQTTLNFNKVTKNRRLFSRKELKQQGMLETEEQDEEESTVGIPSSIRKDSKRYPKLRAEQKAKDISAGSRLTRRRSDR